MSIIYYQVLLCVTLVGILALLSLWKVSRVANSLLRKENLKLLGECVCYNFVIAHCFERMETEKLMFLFFEISDEYLKSPGLVSVPDNFLGHICRNEEYYKLFCKVITDEIEFLSYDVIKSGNAFAHLRSYQKKDKPEKLKKLLEILQTKRSSIFNVSK